MAPPSLLLLLLRPIGVTTAAPATNHPSSIIVSRCRFPSLSPSIISRSRSSSIRSSSRSRRWWSDEQLEDEDDDEEFGFESEDGGGVFGAGWLLDEPWFSKVFRVYGYVLPLILASMMAATGLRGFLLAMAIPLAQSAVSKFAAASTEGGFGFGRRRRRRDSSYWYRQDDDDGSEYYSSDWEEEEEEEEEEEAGQEEFSSSSSNTWAYRDQQKQSWGTDQPAEARAQKSGDASSSKRSTSSAGFGGWDELDRQYQYSSSSSSSRWSASSAAGADSNTADAAGGGDAARARSRQPATEATAAATRRRGGGRRRSARAAGGGAAVRYRQSPLLMRLLVALFPFLGPWFRLL